MSRAEGVGEMIMLQIEDIPQHKQTQASLVAQLYALRMIANRFGLYDAADWLTRELEG